MDAPDALAGLRVLVTRPLAQSDPLARLLQEKGATPVIFPLLQIAEPTDTAALDQTLETFDQFELVIFVSQNAVERAYARLQKIFSTPPATTRFAAVGEATARALQAHGIKNVLYPSTHFDSEALLALPELQSVKNKKIAIVRGEGGRPLLSQVLGERGAHVTLVNAYRRAPVHASGDVLLQHFQTGLAAVVVTSLEGLNELARLLGNETHRLAAVTLVVVSGRAGDAAKTLGLHPAPLIAPNATDAAVVKTLCAWRATQKTL